MSKKKSSSMSGQVCARCTLKTFMSAAYGTSLPCPREKTEDKVMAEEGEGPALGHGGVAA
jgi:hypothetical protein